MVKRMMKYERKVAADYKSLLEKLNCNSRVLIDQLTSLAKNHIEYAATIVMVIRRHISKVHPKFKLPILYLMDSILKHVNKPYAEIFSNYIVEIFCVAFKQANEDTRDKMRRLRQVWRHMLPTEALDALDIGLIPIDNKWRASENKLKYASDLEEEIQQKSRELLKLKQLTLELKLAKTSQLLQENDKMQTYAPPIVSPEPPTTQMENEKRNFIEINKCPNGSARPPTHQVIQQQKPEAPLNRNVSRFNNQPRTQNCFTQQTRGASSRQQNIQQQPKASQDKMSYPSNPNDQHPNGQQRPQRILSQQTPGAPPRPQNIQQQMPPYAPHPCNRNDPRLNRQQRQGTQQLLDPKTPPTHQNIQQQMTNPPYPCNRNDPRLNRRQQRQETQQPLDPKAGSVIRTSELQTNSSKDTSPPATERKSNSTPDKKCSAPSNVTEIFDKKSKTRTVEVNKRPSRDLATLKETNAKRCKTEVVAPHPKESTDVQAADVPTTPLPTPSLSIPEILPKIDIDKLFASLVSVGLIQPIGKKISENVMETSTIDNNVKVDVKDAPESSQRQDLSKEIDNEHFDVDGAFEEIAIDLPSYGKNSTPCIRDGRPGTLGVFSEDLRSEELPETTSADVRNSTPTNSDGSLGGSTEESTLLADEKNSTLPSSAGKPETLGVFLEHLPSDFDEVLETLSRTSSSAAERNSTPPRNDEKPNALTESFEGLTCNFNELPETLFRTSSSDPERNATPPRNDEKPKALTESLKDLTSDFDELPKTLSRSSSLSAERNSTPPTNDEKPKALTESFEDLTSDFDELPETLSRTSSSATERNATPPRNDEKPQALAESLESLTSNFDELPKTLSRSSSSAAERNSTPPRNNEKPGVLTESSEDSTSNFIELPETTSRSSSSADETNSTSLRSDKNPGTLSESSEDLTSDFDELPETLSRSSSSTDERNSTPPTNDESPGTLSVSSEDLTCDFDEIPDKTSRSSSSTDEKNSTPDREDISETPSRSSSTESGIVLDDNLELDYNPLTSNTVPVAVKKIKLNIKTTLRKDKIPVKEKIITNPNSKSCEVKFVEPAITFKQQLQNVKLRNTEKVKRGFEHSGLCSIM